MADKHCTCRQCGAQFSIPSDRRGPTPKYCSARCRWKRQSRTRNAMLSSRKAEATHTCKRCGKIWQGRKHKFCSKRCSNLSRTKTGKSREQLLLEARKRRERVCNHCKKRYVARPDSRQGKHFCSRDCSFAAVAMRKPGPKCSVRFCDCVECGKAFATKKRASICSDECRASQASRRARKAAEEAHKEAADIECVCCGVRFCRLYGEKSKVCSDACRSLLRKADKRKRGNSHRKRAKLYGVTYEPVDPFKVFERDGWRCQMCGHKTPKRLRGTLNPKAPDLDHIIPMSKGGAHSYRNTQCLCRACNGAKSNEVIGQLRLVG